MPITILDLAIFRGAEGKDGVYSAEELHRVGLAALGGCGRCQATLAAYNAAPSQSGFWLCVQGCIDDDGFETVEEANQALFPDEYEWRGPKMAEGIDDPLESRLKRLADSYDQFEQDVVNAARTYSAAEVAKIYAAVSEEIRACITGVDVAQTKKRGK